MTKAMRLKAQIKNLAANKHVPAQAVLQDFMLERLLERISRSKYKHHMVLKGGMLIASMVGMSSRTTMDMDATLGDYPLSKATIREAFETICAVSLPDDVTLVLDHVDPIREDNEYGGYRVAIIARYESINTPLKVDITTGDVITPRPVRYAFRSNFDDRTIEVWAYNLETILAEKIETILRRSVLNTRPRDLYDVYILLKTRPKAIHPATLRRALRATCENRASLPTLQDHVRILKGIRSDAVMGQRWARYCREYSYATGIAFDEAMDMLVGLLGRTQA